MQTKKLKLKNRDVRSLYNAMGDMASLKGSAAFAFSIVRNRHTFKPIVESLHAAAVAWPDDAKEYLAERSKLAESFAVRGLDGQPEIVDGRYRILATPQYQKAVEDMNAKYADARVKAEKWEASIDKLNAADVEVTVTLLTVADIPDGISPEQLELLTPIISDF